MIAHQGNLCLVTSTWSKPFAVKEDEYLLLVPRAFAAWDGLRDAVSTSVFAGVMNATGKRTAVSPFPSQWEESSNSGDH